MWRNAEYYSTNGATSRPPLGKKDPPPTQNPIKLPPLKQAPGAIAPPFDSSQVRRASADSGCSLFDLPDLPPSSRRSTPSSFTFLRESQSSSPTSFEEGVTGKSTLKRRPHSLSQLPTQKEEVENPILKDFPKSRLDELRTWALKEALTCGAKNWDELRATFKDPPDEKTKKALLVREKIVNRILTEVIATGHKKDQLESRTEQLESRTILAIIDAGSKNSKSDLDMTIIGPGECWGVKAFNMVFRHIFNTEAGIKFDTNMYNHGTFVPITLDSPSLKLANTYVPALSESDIKAATKEHLELCHLMDRIIAEDPGSREEWEKQQHIFSMIKIATHFCENFGLKLPKETVLKSMWIEFATQRLNFTEEDSHKAWDKMNDYFEEFRTKFTELCQDQLRSAGMISSIHPLASIMRGIEDESPIRAYMFIQKQLTSPREPNADFIERLSTLVFKAKNLVFEEKLEGVEGLQSNIKSNLTGVKEPQNLEPEQLEIVKDQILRLKFLQSESLFFANESHFSQGATMAVVGSQTGVSIAEMPLYGEHALVQTLQEQLAFFYAKIAHGEFEYTEITHTNPSVRLDHEGIKKRIAHETLVGGSKYVDRFIFMTERLLQLHPDLDHTDILEGIDTLKRLNSEPLKEKRGKAALYPKDWRDTQIQDQICSLFEKVYPLCHSLAHHASDS